MALTKIAAAPIDEHQKLLLVNCVETYLPLKGRDAEEYASLAAAQDSPEIRAMQMTWADKIEAKGLKKGLREGRKEGRQEGREEGREEVAAVLRRMLIRQIGQRFGEVPSAIQQRLNALQSVEKLSTVADRVFEVQSIEELGLGG